MVARRSAVTNGVCSGRLSRSTSTRSIVVTELTASPHASRATSAMRALPSSVGTPASRVSTTSANGVPPSGRTIAMSWVWSSIQPVLLAIGVPAGSPAGMPDR